MSVQSTLSGCRIDAMMNTGSARINVGCVVLKPELVNKRRWLQCKLFDFG